jgi:hypothetical protein
MKHSILLSCVVAMFAVVLVSCGSNANRKVCDQDTYGNDPELCVDRSALGFNTEFGSGTFVGARPVDSISITNRGLRTLEIQKVTYMGDPEFKVSASWSNSNEIPTTSVTGGKTVFLQVEFSPKVGKGYSGNLTIESNAANLPSLGVQLSGCGVLTDGGVSNCYACDVLAQGCTASVDGGPRTCYQSASGATFCAFETGTKNVGEACDAPAACAKGNVCLSVCQRPADGGACAATAESRCYKACNRSGASGCAANQQCLDLSAQGIQRYGVCSL